MSFTSYRFAPGQQTATAAGTCFSIPVLKSVQNWQPVCLCPDPVGSRFRHYGSPGFTLDDGNSGSTSGAETIAQIYLTMKNARKQPGDLAANQRPDSPLPIMDNPDDLSLFEDDVFSTKPAPRPPESPEVESLRSLLKSSLPRHKASPDLLRRIRSSIQDEKG